MAGGYKFKSKTDALYNKQQSITRPGPRAGSGPVITNLYWFKAPSGGIPAKSGTRFGSATCDAYFIDEDGDLTAMTDSGGTQITATVWNGFSAVSGDGGGYLLCGLGDGKYQVVSEDCP